MKTVNISVSSYALIILRFLLLNANYAGDPIGTYSKLARWINDTGKWFEVMRYTGIGEGMYVDERQRTIEWERERNKERIIDRERKRDREGFWQIGRLLKQRHGGVARWNWRREEDLDEREKRTQQKEREREGISRGKRRAARYSCHDGPRSSIFRAEIKWRNERMPSLEYPLGARRARRRWSLFLAYLFHPFLLLSLSRCSHSRSFFARPFHSRVCLHRAADLPNEPSERICQQLGEHTYTPRCTIGLSEARNCETWLPRSRRPSGHPGSLAADRSPRVCDARNPDFAIQLVIVSAMTVIV